MKSQPEELVIPEFRSDIPEYLTENLSAKDKHIMQTLSEIKHNALWQSPVLAKLYKQAQITNGRVNESEEKIEALEKRIADAERKLRHLDKLLKIVEVVSSKIFIWSFLALLFAFLGVIYPWLLTFSYGQLIPLLKLIF